MKPSTSALSFFLMQRLYSLFYFLPVAAWRHAIIAEEEAMKIGDACETAIICDVTYRVGGGGE